MRSAYAVACVVFALLTTHAALGLAVTPPFSADFDLEATCSGSCAVSCVLMQSGFANETTDDNDWAVDIGGTLSPDTGPPGDHTTGSDNYLYVETSAPCSSRMDVSRVTSPPLELTGTTLPVARFWYHMFGAEIGTLNVDVLDDMGALLQADVIAAVSGDQGNQWTESATIDLAPFIAQGTVHVQISYTHSGGGFHGDAAIDDFSFIDAGASDVGVRSIDSPADGCEYGMESVTVTLENFSGVTETGFDVALVVDGAAPIVETYNGTLVAFGSDTFTFSALADLSASGGHTLDVQTQLASDAIPGNDNASLAIYNGQVLTAPTLVDFESATATDDWITGGANSDWALGTPNDATINSAFSGSNSWVTDLTQNNNLNQMSFVQSLCGFDLSGLANPAVRMAIWVEANNNQATHVHGAVLQSSTDGGMSWQNVGSVGSGKNWYNSAAVTGMPGGSLEGWTGSGNTGTGDWVYAINDVAGVAGQSDALFRVAFGSTAFNAREGVAFDDFEIFEIPVGGPVVLSGFAGEPTTTIGAFPPLSMLHVPDARAGVLHHQRNPVDATHHQCRQRVRYRCRLASLSRRRRRRLRSWARPPRRLASAGERRGRVHAGNADRVACDHTISRGGGGAADGPRRWRHHQRSFERCRSGSRRRECNVGRRPHDLRHVPDRRARRSAVRR